MSSRNLSIKGKKKGERVAVSDCNIEPLNLLIPGGGPILVPKQKAWPGQRKKMTVTVKVPMEDEDYYDAEEEDELEERPAAAVKSRKASQAVKVNSEMKRRKVACKVDAKKSTKAHVEDREREKLMQCIEAQEEYIAQLKAKYKYKNKKTGAKAPEEIESDADVDTETDTTTADDATQTTEDETSGAGATDDAASEKARNMLKAISIKAAGTDGAGFTPSEDAQILARKEANESFKMIASFMKRPKKQISQRYNELIKAGKTAETAGTDGPGESATAGVAKAGDTTDAETTDAKKTNDGENDAQVAEGDFGGLFDIGDLTDALKAVEAEQVVTEKKKKDSPAKKSDKPSNKGKNQQNELSPAGKPKGEVKKTPPKAANGGESGYEGGSEAVPDDAGARLYINQYARHLLRHQDRIPEADDKFDENDCIMLAMAESYLKHGKWEQIQARFANATGRMVPIEVLKYKLGGGEKPDYY